jgi:hypothetical protein
MAKLASAKRMGCADQKKPPGHSFARPWAGSLLVGEHEIERNSAGKRLRHG